MKNIFAIFKRDLRKIFNNSIAIILVVGILLLPSLYAWINIYANWDPYGKTNNMMVAVCNEDEGASYRNIDIAIGDQICDNLRGNSAIDWQFVSKDEAVNGVEAGEYYAAIEIPSGFSKNLASIVTDEYKRPQIVYYANEKKNAIATKITDKVVQTVQTSVNESFVTTVVDVMSAVIGTAVDEKIGGDESTLEHLKSQVNDAKSTISSLDDTLQNFQQLLAMIENMNASLSDKDLEALLNNTTQLVNDTTEAVQVTQGALDTVFNSMGNIMTNTSKTLNSTATSLEKYADKDMSSAVALMKQTSTDLALINNEIVQINKILANIDNALTKVGISSSSDLRSDIQGLMKRLDGISASLKGLSATLEKTSSVDYDKTLLDVAKKLREVSKSLAAAQKSYDKDIAPVLNKTVDSLVVSLGDISNILEVLEGKAPSISTLVSTLQESAKLGDNMLGSMSKVLIDINDKLDKLVKALENVENSEIVNAFVNLTTENGGDLGEFLACPVEVVTDKVYGIENYGSAMAPFYSTLAIWVGSMFLVALVKVNIKKKKEISQSPLKNHELFFGRGLLFVGLGIIQGLIICLGDLYFLRIQCYHPVKFMLAGILASIVFSLFIYSLVYCFGEVGKAVGVILLVIQIGGSGGTFPIHVTPQFFIAVNPYLPFTFVIEAMRECICGTYGSVYWIYLLKLLAYAVLALVFGLFVKLIVKKPVHFFENKIEETGIF